MKHENLYREWLPNNKVQTKESADSYISRLKSVEKVLGNTIKNLDDFIEKELDKINSKNFPDLKNERSLSDMKSALKKYWSFIKDKQA